MNKFGNNAQVDGLSGNTILRIDLDEINRLLPKENRLDLDSISYYPISEIEDKLCLLLFLNWRRDLQENEDDYMEISEQPTKGYLNINEKEYFEEIYTTIWRKREESGTISPEDIQ